VDTLRADHLRAGLTPNLDAMAADGVVFEQAFAQASWTRSSGASLWTSRLPSSHNADTKAARLSEDAVLWSEVLQDAGVTTGALVNNINLTESFGFNQGFDTFVYESPDYSFGGTESVFALTFYKVVHKVAEKVFGGNKAVSSYYQPAPVVLADAQAFIEANNDSRWALYVHLMEPHDPYCKTRRRRSSTESALPAPKLSILIRQMRTTCAKSTPTKCAGSTAKSLPSWSG
jgi:arylsulfatase A-like enzyme